MRAKQISFTGHERLIMQVTITQEIKSSMASESLSIEPVFSVEELKALYKKISGHEWDH